jgi:hypothetical protein
MSGLERFWLGFWDSQVVDKGNWIENETRKRTRGEVQNICAALPLYISLSA